MFIINSNLSRAIFSSSVHFYYRKFTFLVKGDELLYGICEAVDEEKDPDCLMLSFQLVEIVIRLFPDPSDLVTRFAGDIFEILSKYFPVYFTHVSLADSATFFFSFFTVFFYQHIILCSSLYMRSFACISEKLCWHF